MVVGVKRCNLIHLIIRMGDFTVVVAEEVGVGFIRDRNRRMSSKVSVVMVEGIVEVLDRQTTRTVVVERHNRAGEEIITVGEILVGVMAII